MNILLIILAISIIFGMFIYFLTGLDKINRKLNPSNGIKAGVDREDPRLIFKGKWDKNVPRPRICPICGTYLEKKDYLFAAMGPEPPPEASYKRQVKIYGCPYCYPEKNPKLTKTAI